MLRSTLKRNLLPIALITLGGLIFMAIILYVFRAHLATVLWVLFGLFLIGIGVIGIVVNNPKHKIRAGDTPSRSSPAGPGSPPPTTAPVFSPVGTREIKPGRQDTITISRPLLIAVGVLFVCLVLLLLGNVGTVLRSLLTVRKTQIIDCREAADYAEDGWQFVSTYSYRSEDEVAGYTEHTACVMERERFVWARDKRTSKKDDVSIDDVSTNDTSFDDDAAIYDPVPYLDPTQPYLPPSLDTPAPLPTATFEPMSSPLPTWTPPPFTPEPTFTPLPPSPTATPIPRTDIVVCDAILDDTYLDIYVQWEGMIIDDPAFEDEGLWFQVQWTNSDPNGTCDESTFFVSYDSEDRLFAEDVVIVTGTIIDTAYEDEGESGETDYFVVVRADHVEFLDD